MKDEESKAAKKFRRWPIGCVVVLILPFALYQCLPSYPPSFKTVDTSEPDECRKFIAVLKTEGVVQSQPSATKLIVHDKRWSELKADDKVTLGRTLYCSAYEGRSNEFDSRPDDLVEVFGTPSGVRFAVVDDEDFKFVGYLEMQKAKE